MPSRPHQTPKSCTTVVVGNEQVLPSTRSELLNSSGERASASRSILPARSAGRGARGKALVVCLLNMVAGYRPGSFRWMQMHRKHGT